MKLGIASDHAGYTLKVKIMEYLDKKGISYENYGTNSPDPVDYSVYGHKLASSVENGAVNMGISICGSGNGINMTANKHQGIRSALCWNKEISHLARLHNDANILAIPGRFVTFEEAYAIVDEFLNTPFEGGRHEARVKNIPLK